MTSAGAAPTGIVLVDKPSGMTSHDVVSRARRALSTRKVGHAGTLDPMATGLLVLGVGSSTRLLTYLVGLDKQYAATIRLGVSTATDDAEGDATSSTDASHVSRDDIDARVAALTGEIDQVPSSFSAIKVDGRRSYDRARAGEEVVLAPRRVTISRFDVLDERRNVPGVVDVDVAVTCSSGTYVRALARDLGAALGVGGHLTALRRQSIGPFPVSEAVDLDELDAKALRTAASAATLVLPTVQLNGAQATDLAHGKRVSVTDPDLATAAALTPDGRLAGIVAVAQGIARVLVNFPSDEVGA